MSLMSPEDRQRIVVQNEYLTQSRKQHVSSSTDGNSQQNSRTQMTSSNVNDYVS